MEAEAEVARILSTMGRAHNATIDGDALEASRRLGAYGVSTPRRAARRCGALSAEHERLLFSSSSSAEAAAQLPVPPPLQRELGEHASPRPPLPIATCADNAGRLGTGVRLLIGVHSAPDRAGRLRRDGIRSTWMRYAGAGHSALVCFVLGRRGIRRSEARRLDAEHARHRDMVWLNETVDGAGPFVTISKLHAWLRHVAEWLPPPPLPSSVRHVAKVDDDTFINLPLLQARLDALWCHDALYYGVLAYAGYRPATFSKCGFDYSLRGGRYRQYGCANAANALGAAHPPFPFTNGPLMLVSTPLVHMLVRSPDVSAFVRRSEVSHHTDEDVALGFWLSRFHLARLANVSYVRIDRHLTNLGCFRKSALYAPPKRSADGVHFVKTSGGMRYVWGVIAANETVNATRCRLMTGDGRL